VRFPCVHAVATTPAQRLGVLLRSFTPPYQPSPISLSGRPARRPFRGLLGVHLRYGLHTRAVTVYRDTLSEGFSHFVTSMTAPVASGWSVRRVGFAPTEKRRLSTAHGKSRHQSDRRKWVACDPKRSLPLECQFDQQMFWVYDLFLWADLLAPFHKPWSLLNRALLMSFIEQKQKSHAQRSPLHDSSEPKRRALLRLGWREKRYSEFARWCSAIR
jgi:hypothetical protein